jgi:hypothetical protein
MAGFTSALLQYTCASVLMMAGNKLAVGFMPLPCALVVIQAVGTLLIMLVVTPKDILGFRLAVAAKWLPIAVAFAFVLFTGLKSFMYVSVGTLLVFRNVSAIVSTVVEYFVRGVTVNARIVLAQVAIVCGAVCYGSGSIEFTWIGLLWIMINISSQVGYSVTVKKMSDVFPEFKAMTKYEMSTYNNILAIPIVGAMGLAMGEHARVAAVAGALEPYGAGVVVLSALLGFAISTTGFGLQKLTTASTFLVIGNLIKFVNLGVSYLFFGMKLTGFLDTFGCVLALLAGAWYSYEMQRHQKMVAADEAAAKAGGGAAKPKAPGAAPTWKTL